MSVVLRVTPDDPTPPYEQLRRQLSALIANGVLEDGRRLPTVRQLAADLRLAPGTIARTYQELERSGLIETRRGAGTRVRGAAPRLTDATRRAELSRLAQDLVSSARLLGADDAEIRSALDAALTSRRRASDR